MFRMTLLFVGLVPSIAQAQITPGTLYAWGDNSSGQRTIPGTIDRVVGISAGGLHSLALRPDGSVVTWGNSADTRLAVPAGLPGMVAVAAGGQHSLALGTNGLVYGWGDDAFNQQTPPAGLASVVAIAAGESHSLALRSDGRVFVWGSNDRQQAPPNFNLPGVIAIAAGDGHNLALRNNNTVVAWGDNTALQSSVPNLFNVVAIAAGSRHSLALRSDGRVFAWGDNTYGQSAVPVLSGVQKIAAGGNVSMALLADGTVRVWGDTTFSQTTVPAGVTNIQLMAAGTFHCLAVRVEPPAITAQPADASVLVGSPVTFSVTATGATPLAYQWKLNGTDIPGATGSTYTIDVTAPANAGNYTVVISNSRASVTSRAAVLVVRVPPVISVPPRSLDIGAGAQASFTVTATGPSLNYQWRRNGGNIPLGTASGYIIRTAQVSDTGNYDVVITNIYGSATSSVAVLTVHPLPAVVRNPASVEAMVGVNVQFSADATDSTGFRWLHDQSPVPGAGEASLVIAPVKAADSGAYQVNATNLWGSAPSSPAILSLVPPAGFMQVVGWGESQPWNGQRAVDVSPPVGMSGIHAVAAGYFHGLALRANGTVWGWGDNSHNESASPVGLSGVTAIAAGDGFSLALLASGKVTGWGRSESGQLSIPSTLSQVTAIAAGMSHALALRSDGTVVAWGSNHAGETSVPAGLGKVTAIAAGADFSLAVTEAGTVVGWGANDLSQRRPPARLSGVVQVAAGHAHSVALLASGKVVAWGDNSQGQTTVPPLSHPAVALAAGGDHTLAMLANGEVRVWGKNNAGQGDLPADLQSVLGIAAAGDHCLVLRQRTLQFLPARLSPPGGIRSIRLQLANADGTAIDADRATRIAVLSSTDLSAPLGAWRRLVTPAPSTGGFLVWVETLATDRGPVFYVAVENP
jgi:alpha-tubulin suppressor-like RCC1 family protein